MAATSQFELGREDYERGDMRLSHAPERTAGWDAAHRDSWLARNHVWTEAAKALGWEWSGAYAGYIRADYHPKGARHHFTSYPSEVDAEGACAIDGIETIEQAEALLARQKEG